MKVLSLAGLLLAAAMCVWAVLVPSGLAQTVGQTGSLAEAGQGSGDAATDPGHHANDDIPAETCLACHGPFDVLRQTTRDWVAPSGIAVNPHVTFDKTNPAAPHASGQGVLPCTQCHVPHPIPIVEPVPGAQVEACAACHHTRTFRACSECH